MEYEKIWSNVITDCYEECLVGNYFDVKRSLSLWIEEMLHKQEYEYLLDNGKRFISLLNWMVVNEEWFNANECYIFEYKCTSSVNDYLWVVHLIKSVGDGVSIEG